MSPSIEVAIIEAKRQKKWYTKYLEFIPEGMKEAKLKEIIQKQTRILPSKIRYTGNLGFMHMKTKENLNQLLRIRLIKINNTFNKIYITKGNSEDKYTLLIVYMEKHLPNPGQKH